MKPPLAHLRAELDGLRDAGLLRERRPARAQGALSFSSNDYLGLADEPLPRHPDVPGGAGASRLVAGERPPHRELERALADWLGTEDALLFPSGFAANLGLVTALVGPSDVVVSDALNHASLVDGCRLARASTRVVPHLDLAAVRQALAERPAGDARAWVIAESYYSMDADGPDLTELRAICDDAGAGLLLDEAHALGVLGPEGRGCAEAAGVDAEARTGTLGKAFGLAGAFVAGSADLVAWLWNRARPFVFSTGMSPALCEAARERLVTVRAADPQRRRVLALAARLRAGLLDLGADVRGHGHVVPLVLGTPQRALAVSEALAASGFDVPAIRPPTVPPGTARLRFALTARHAEADVEALLAALRTALQAT